jgi:hypothetical protein
MNNASDGHHDWDTLIRCVFVSSRYVVLEMGTETTLYLSTVLC